jgi:NADPH:quinone reductase
MKAVFYARFGGAEVMRVGEVEAPVPAPGEVLIRVRAAAINPVDWKIREGFLKNYLPFAFPIIPGWDAAGDIAALGEGVVGWTIGERVMAYARKATIQWGCMAEYVAVPADWLARTPKVLDDRAASAIPLAGLTAWQALVEVGGLAAGQTALITAAAGGVGSFAVPIAKAKGARVIATCSPANADYVRGLGADVVLDYHAADWAAQAGPVDVALDSVGGATLTALMGLVKAGGTLVGLNDPPDPDQCAARGIRPHRLFATPHGGQLAALLALVDSGQVPVPPVQAFALDDVAAAMTLNQAGHVRGKLVLDVR